MGKGINDTLGRRDQEMFEFYIELMKGYKELATQVRKKFLYEQVAEKFHLMSYETAGKIIRSKLQGKKRPCEIS